MSKIFFTSDLHFGHARLIEKYRTKFKSVQEMDDAIIAGWRQVVTEKDTVYVLGDLSFRRTTETVAILERLPGHKMLVRGNHDKGVDKPAVRKYFERIEDIIEIKVPDPDAYWGPEDSKTKQRIVMCHYPMITWSGSHYGSWMLHGHCHGTLQANKFPNAKRLDVGIDNVGFSPVSYEWVKEFMSRCQFEPVDHHKQKAPY